MVKVFSTKYDSGHFRIQWIIPKWDAFNPTLGLSTVVPDFQSLFDYELLKFYFQNFFCLT